MKTAFLFLALIGFAGTPAPCPDQPETTIEIPERVFDPCDYMSTLAQDECVQRLTLAI